MGFDVERHGTAGLVLSLAATDATGTATVKCMSEGREKCRITVEVDTYAGWGGTVTVTPKYVTGQTRGSEPTAVVVGDIVQHGATGHGAVDVAADGYDELTIAVAGNDKVMRVYAKTFGNLAR